MKLDVIMIVGVAAIAILMALLIFLPRTEHVAASNTKLVQNGSPGIYRMSLTSDRGSYEEDSKANFTVSLTSPRVVTGELKLWGVKNRYGTYKVDETEAVNLTQGVNTISRSVKLPACSSCAGIDPGNFTVYVALYVNDTQIINSSTQIRITE